MLPPDGLKPNPARMYDYLLGGFHNFEVDRQAVAQLITTNPEAPFIARCNRAFLQRVIAYSLDQGIDQFLDIGAGVPTVGNTHQVVQQRNPQAHTLYVDIDELTVNYGEALLATTPTADFIQADIRETSAIVNHPITRRLLDWTRPMAVLATSVLQFVLDTEQATNAIQQLTARLPIGSIVAISHPVDADYDHDNLDQMEELYQRTSRPYRTRSQPAVEAFFAGLVLIEPGIVYLPSWHPNGPDDLLLREPSRALLVGGVGQHAESRMQTPDS